MKKAITLILSSILMLALVTCGGNGDSGSDTNSDTPSGSNIATPIPTTTPAPEENIVSAPEKTPEPTPTPNLFNPEEVSGQIAVTDYTWSTRYGNYLALVLENNSEYMLEISAQIIFKDENGNNIGAKNDSD